MPHSWQLPVFNDISLTYPGTLDKSNAASDDQIFQDIPFFFKFAEKKYAVVRAPKELRPIWEQAKERCQKLANRLGPGVRGELAPIMKTAEKYVFIACNLSPTICMGFLSVNPCAILKSSTY